MRHPQLLQVSQIFVVLLQTPEARRSADGSPHHRSTVDTAELQQAPELKPLRINKNNFAGLEAQGEQRLPSGLLHLHEVFAVCLVVLFDEHQEPLCCL